MVQKPANPSRTKRKKLPSSKKRRGKAKKLRALLGAGNDMKQGHMGDWLLPVTELISPAAIEGPLDEVDLHHLRTALFDPKRPLPAWFTTVEETTLLPTHMLQLVVDFCWDNTEPYWCDGTKRDEDVLWGLHIEAVHGAAIFNGDKNEEGRNWRHKNCKVDGSGGRTWVALVSIQHMLFPTSLVASTKRRPRQYILDAKMKLPTHPQGKLWRADKKCVKERETTLLQSSVKHVNAVRRYKENGACRPPGGWPAQAILGLVLFDGDVGPVELLSDERYRHRSFSAGTKPFKHHWKLRALVKFGTPISNVRYKTDGMGNTGNLETLFGGFKLLPGLSLSLRQEVLRRLPGLF